MSFEKAYEVDHHGKNDWLVSEERKSDFMVGLLVPMTITRMALLGKIFIGLGILEQFLMLWRMKIVGQINLFLI